MYVEVVVCVERGARFVGLKVESDGRGRNVGVEERSEAIQTVKVDVQRKEVAE